MARKEGWSRCRSTRREECDKRGGEQRAGTAERLVSGGAASMDSYWLSIKRGRTPHPEDFY